jgi:hypothetical protein
MYRGALENKLTKSESSSIEPGDTEREGTNEPSAPESLGMLMDLVSSIKKIEDYLIVHDAEKLNQDEWPIAAGRSSFYLWLKETYWRRSLRSKYFNQDYFTGEAAWNILLDLASSHIEGKLISVTSACLASGVPPTTALRWISLLIDDGMVEKENDYSDKRRTFMRISERGMSLIYSYYKKLHSYPANSRRKLD